MAKKNIGKANPYELDAVMLGICAVLFVLTWIVFGQTTAFTFINYDDGRYVYANPEVTKGLSLEGIGWAFTHVHGGNWYPLTTISHLLDCQFYGLKAGGHHLTNVLLHSIAVILLFLLLRQMTGAQWRSAFVAALFAIHPLRAESVAWIAERKDVLSGVFFMLTLIAYVRYVRKPSTPRYWTVPCLFALGLMSKPMLVTLPFILLLLDYWPLGRLRNFSLATAKPDSVHNARSLQQLLVEKIPLFNLSAMSCVATLMAQTRAIATAEQLSVGARICNAFLSCVAYLGQMFWPFRLGLFYPYPEHGLLAKGVLSAALLILITASVFVLRKTHPYLITGWLWYLGMLVPVIGIIQVGLQSHADRYTYLSQIGLSIALVWGVTDVSRAWRHRREILSAAAVLTIAVLSVAAWIQTSYWADSEKIWGHTLAIAPNSSLAQSSFGNALRSKGHTSDAIPYYENAIALRPEDAEGHSTLANALRHSGRLAEAIGQFRKVLELRSRQEETKEAEAHYNLANALLEKNQVSEAIEQYRHALELEPNNLDYHNNLGNALLRQGLEAAAIDEYERVLTIDPTSVAARGNVAWILATSFNPERRQGFRALELARQANELSGERDPIVLNALAAAYAETGQFAKAVSTAQQALDLASQGNPQLARLLRQEIALFRAGSPYHAPSR